MIGWRRAVAGALLAGVAACGDGIDVDADEAVALAEATSGPVAYTTTYAADLVPPLGGVQGTIEGDQHDRDHASFHVSAGFIDPGPGLGGTPPRSFTLDDGGTVLGRLAVVPTDLLGLVGTGDGLEAAGTGRGFGDERVARFREALDPGVLQPRLAAFLTDTLHWLVGPLSAEAAAEVGASVAVRGATLELLVLPDGSAVDSVVFHVRYEIDGARFDAAVEPYLPTRPTGETGSVVPSGLVDAAANIRLVITG